MSALHDHVLDRFQNEKGNHPEAATALRFLGTRLRKVLETSSVKEMDNVHDLYELCSEIDGALSDLLSLEGVEVMNPEAEAAVAKIRLEIGQSLIGRIYDEKREALERSDVKGRRALKEQQALVEGIFPLIPRLQQMEEGDVFDPTWLQVHVPETHPDLVRLLRDAEKMVHWEDLKPLLPEGLKPQISLLPSNAEKEDPEVLNVIHQHRRLAKFLGPEALTDFLVAAYPEIIEDTERTMNIISTHVGRTAPREMEVSDFADLPELMLENVKLKEVMRYHLERYVYRQLVAKKGDSNVPMREYKNELKTIEKKLRTVIQDGKGETLKGKGAHSDLLDEVVALWKDVINMPVPKRLKNKVPRKNREGETFIFPSLRQRFAAKKMEAGQPILIDFDQGFGKTAASFLAFEHLECKKMLFVCITGMENDIEQQIYRHYKAKDPKDESIKLPSVGVICSGTQPEDLPALLASDIVVVSYSMITGARNLNLVENLGNANFDFMTVDEVHWGKKIEGAYTNAIWELSKTIGDDEGNKRHIAMLSGNAVPNTPEDILPQLRIHDPSLFPEDDEGNTDLSLRALAEQLESKDPLALRPHLMNLVLNLDKPRDWQKYLKVVDVPVNYNQREFYKMLLQNTEMDFDEKLRVLCLFLANPRLVTDEPMENSMLDFCEETIISDFEEGHDAVIVAEDHFKQGILTRHEDEEYSHIPSFAEELEARLYKKYGDQLFFGVIHGGTSKADRDAYLDKARKPAGQKVVILSWLPIIREGRDLSEINRAILLSPPYRMADVQQFVTRFAREGNEEALVRLFNAPGTIYDAMYRHAVFKAILNQRLMQGGGLTRGELQYLEQKDKGGESKTRRGRFIVGGTDVSAATKSTLQILDAIHEYFRKDRGSRDFLDFLASQESLYVEACTEGWETSESGNRSRFTSSLIRRLENEYYVDGIDYADVACGPLALQNTHGLHYEVNITNFDLSPEMMEAGKKMYQTRCMDPEAEVDSKISNMTDIKAGDESFHLLHCGDAFDLLNGNRAQTNVESSERAMALLEFNRVLKPGGVLVLTFAETSCTDEQFKNIRKAMKSFGFEVQPDFTGKAYTGRRTTKPGENQALCRTLVAKKVKRPDELDYESIDPKLLRMNPHSETPEDSLQQREWNCDLIFNIKDEELKYTANETEQELSPEFRAYRRKVMVTRNRLRSLFYEHNSFKKVQEHHATDLGRYGVSLFSVLNKDKTGRQWCFSFKGDTHAPGKNHVIFED